MIRAHVPRQVADIDALGIDEKEDSAGATRRGAALPLRAAPLFVMQGISMDDSKSPCGMAANGSAE